MEKKKACNEDVLHEQAEEKICSEMLNFITKVDCQYEMYETMAPLYSKNADERKKKIDKIRDELKASKNGKIDLKKINLFHNFVNEVNKYYDSLETLKQSTLIMLVSKYDEYVSTLIGIIYQDKKTLIRSSNKSYTIAELSSFGSYDAIFESAIKEEVERIGYASHRDQLEELNIKHKLGIFDDFLMLETFIEACERRNLYVHAGGCINKKYLENAKKYGFPIEKSKKEGDFLPLDEKYLYNSYKAILEVGTILGLSLFRREYDKSYEMIDHFFNEEIGYKYLKEEKWDIAELLFRYINKLGKKYLSSEEYYYLYIVNYCIALKHNGKNDQLEKLLLENDFSALKSVFKLAKLVLLEKYEEASKYMLSIPRKEIGDSEYTEWPLFLEFRNTEYFRVSYKKLFKKDYLAVAIQEIEINTTRMEMIGDCGKKI